jgi:hypothetical protein
MRLCLRSILPFVCIVVLGCGKNCENGPDAGPFGPVKQSALLAPFVGEWTLDFEKTMVALKEAGASDEVIKQVRKNAGEFSHLRPYHSDITLTGDIAFSSGSLSSEYRFYSMHQHGDKICGKAWHHEDRFDPGDMSKCYVRLMIKEGNLYMQVRMEEDPPELNDPELRSLPATEGGSATDCRADKIKEPGWDDWTTYVFTRKR